GESLISAFFVYGTLKRGQLRGKLWPREPLCVTPGLIQADLFDLGPYPAAAHGSQWLLGELWQFKATDMPATIANLDRIEGCSALGKENEYVREVVRVQMVSAECDIGMAEMEAYVYFISNPIRLEKARQISPFFQYMQRLVSAWPDPKSRVPKNFEQE
ncbi:MAG: gamma-glutamylcyclotransferase family protein, partial [Pirellula sp.]